MPPRKSSTAKATTTSTRGSRKTRSLRVASAEDAPPPKPKPKPISSLVDAIERGTYEDVLVWQRKEAVKSLATLTGPALAAMHRQIAQLSKEIESIRAARTEGTDIGAAIATPDEDYDPEDC